jgi:uncharacterized membrane protein
MNPEPALTRAQRMSDSVAHFAGSWAFVIAAVALVIAWIVCSKQVSDPYPYIALNLILTIVSTLQGPLIMMSQNREAERDREYVRQILERIEELQHGR